MTMQTVLTELDSSLPFEQLLTLHRIRLTPKQACRMIKQNYLVTAPAEADLQPVTKEEHDYEKTYDKGYPIPFENNPKVRKGQNYLHYRYIRIFQKDGTEKLRFYKPFPPLSKKARLSL